MANTDDSKGARKGQPARSDLSAEYLRACFRYNPQTGDLSWRARPGSHFASPGVQRSWNVRYAGKEAGRLMAKASAKKYRSVYVKGRHIACHRVIWWMVSGTPPAQTLRHISGSGLDNSWGNLQETSPLESSRRRKLHPANTTGVVGVTWCKTYLLWRAQIASNGRTIALGRYRDISDAVRARKAAEMEYGYPARPVSEKSS